MVDLKNVFSCEAPLSTWVEPVIWVEFDGPTHFSPIFWRVGVTPQPGGSIDNPLTDRIFVGVR